MYAACCRYEATAEGVKSVLPNAKVGGPASSAGGWLASFLNATNASHVDFISTHAYPDPTDPRYGVCVCVHALCRRLKKHASR